MQINRILVPTDFSTFSDAALRYATSLAVETGAKLSIVHCQETCMTYVDGGFGSFPIEEDSAAAQRQLAITVPPSPQVGYSQHYLKGHPADAIVEFAAQDNSDMIILGTHGRRGVSRLLMGSVAEEIVRKAKCPVITVKLPSDAMVES